MPSGEHRDHSEPASNNADKFESDTTGDEDRSPDDTSKSGLYSSWLRAKLLWHGIPIALEALVLIGRIQYVIYNCIGFALQTASTLYLMPLRGLLFIGNLHRRLLKSFRQHPSPRCSACHALVENCNSAYEFRRLDSSRSEIRLLRVLSKHEEYLQVELANFSLPEAPVFAALSYRWTKDEPVCVLIAGSQSFNVRPNLYHYLLTVKAKGDDGWLFIDALCINQHDVDERSRQVGLMGEIDSRASEVMVWLPPSTEIKHAVTKFIDSVEGLQASKLPEASEELRWQMMTMVIQSLDRSDDENSRSLYEKIIWGLLCGDDYWTRLWPIQELLLAQRLTLCCSGLIIDGARLPAILAKHNSELYNVVASQPDTPAHKLFQNTSEGMIHMIVMMTAVSNLKYDRGLDFSVDIRMPLHEAIIAFAGQRCTDRRDRVFGLLGIVQPSVTADYRMSAAEVYLRALIEGMMALMGQLMAYESSVELHDKMINFCWSLLHALGMDEVSPAVGLITKTVINRLNPPRWVHDGLSWTRLNVDGAFIRRLRSLVQSDGDLGDFCRAVWGLFFYERLFYEVSRTFFEGRHPWMRKFRTWDRHPWLAAFLAEAIFGRCYYFSRVPLQVYEAHNTRMALPGADEDVRTYTEWHRLADQVFQDMQGSGVVP